MRILGLVFAGTATNARVEMTEFVEQTLGLKPVEVGGVEADMFELPDGANFAVAGPRFTAPMTRLRRSWRATPS